MSGFLQRFQKAHIPSGGLQQQEHDRLASQETLIQYAAPSPSGRGKSPSGSMQIEFRPHIPCPGFASGGTIQISYAIPSCTQLSCHPHPGVPYDGTDRQAYLPNTAEGRCLLTRFRYAFSNGFMFQVGTSVTTGRDHQVTWTAIPNKSSLKPGPFGFPDPKYIQKANKELDKMSIPSADDCLSSASSFYSNGTQQDQSSTSFRNLNNGNGNGNGNDHLFVVQKETIHYQAPTCLSTSLQTGVLQPLASTSTTTTMSPPPFTAPAAIMMPGLPPLPPPLPPPSAPPCTSTGIHQLQPPPHTALQPAKLITVDDLDKPSVLGSLSTFLNQYAPAALTNNTNDLQQPAAAAAAAAATTNHHPTGSDSFCAICLDNLSAEPSVQLSSCQHAFHQSCITDALKQNSKCPVCRKPVGGAEPQGKSPSGSMNIDVSKDKVCPGFGRDKPGVISIAYEIPSGSQESYHDHPGERYDGTTRVAFLPTTLEGRQLLYRLKYAWTHGLTFRVGASLTTGQANQVTWASIHHKTSLYGGPHGFPDDKYLDNCNTSLDALHVPPAKDCII